MNGQVETKKWLANVIKWQYDWKVGMDFIKYLPRVIITNLFWCRKIPLRLLTQIELYLGALMGFDCLS